MAKSKFEIHFLPKASDDLDEIITYISNENNAVSLKMFNLFESKILKLSEYPYAGEESGSRDLKKLGYRTLHIKNYSVFYRVEDNSILICRILHSAGDYMSIINP